MVIVSVFLLIFLALGFPLFLTDTLHLCLRFLKMVKESWWCAGEPLSGGKRKKNSYQRCEHTDPAMLNLTAARSHIPDTSDDNFTTGFQPPLQH